MSEESLIFSVLGLTVRGFHCNADKWVPKGGQRLSCALRSGAIDVLKDDQSVGKVATEAPNKFKDWLKADGTIEAVVIGLPKKHRGKKGEEVPVMFVFRSKKDYRMIKFKKAITSGISKLKKKSTKVVDGDASEEMTFSDTDENQFEFSVRGMTMRGFHVYNKLWVPEIGDRILCSVNDDHSVEMVKDGQTIGHVQTEGQALFRKFIKAKGVIHAVVNAEPKQHRSKGEEIPVIYQFSADDWTNRLQNIRNEIRNDIKKGSEKKKSLKFIRSNEESQNEAGPSYETQSMDRAGTSGENKFSTKVSEQMKNSNENIVDDMEDISAVSNESHPENTENGKGEKISDRKNSSGQVKKSRKRRADERTGGSVEKIPKTEKIQKIERSAKNEQTAEKLPDAEASRNTTQLPKKEKNTTATTEGTKKQPKTKKAQQSGSGKQRLKQKGEKVENKKGNREGQDLVSEHGEIKFKFVPLKPGQSFGSFTYTHGHMETLMELEAKVKASLSVCKIFYPIVGGSTTASGFRVGSRYIMTAAHVTNNFQKGLQNSDTYVIFNYKYDGIYKRKDKYLIKEVVYSNDETDIAVVELLDHQRVMPPHVTSFCSPVLDRSFHLIGHSKGNVMETNLVTKIIDKDDPKIKFCLDQLQRMSCQHTGGKGYDTPPNDSVHNPYRFLFQCKFTKGASGSPGIVLVGKTIYVTTVLLHGYPDWYYDPTMEVYKNNWLDEHCVQQGVNIMSVCEMMRATHPSLCQDIFGKQQC